MMYSLVNRKFLLQALGVGKEARQSYFKKFRRKKRGGGDDDCDDEAPVCESKKKRVVKCKQHTIQANPCSPVIRHASPLKYKILFILAVPAIGYLSYAFLFSENPPKMQKAPLVPYEYLRRRTKRFPWGEGEKSLFHNDHTNVLPSDFSE